MNRATTPLDTPLAGGLLIEASAGTGKTYALTTLAARAVVELRLAIDKLLIVTFTIAATGELRARLRRTLRLALDAVASGRSDDAQALALLGRWQQREDMGEAKALLERAVRDLDRANVMTIHGLCQRLLAEFAFEGGVPFGFAVSGDDAGDVRAAVRDYWRRHIVSAPTHLIEYAGNERFTLGDATGWVQGHHAKPALDVRGDDGSASEEQMQSANATWMAAFAETRRVWRQHGPGFLQALDALGWHSNSARKMKRVREAAAKAFANDDPSALRLEEAGYLGSRSLLRILRKGQNLPESPLCAQFDRLGDAATQLASLSGLWLQQQRRSILQEVRSTLRQEAWRHRRLSFNGLLTETARALFDPAGGRLAQRVQERYPLALIDEFQDTDGLQARIFQRIYANAGEDPAQPGIGLAIVGDPKQSIYGFRGADVFAYLQGTSDNDLRSQLAASLAAKDETSRAASASGVRRLRLAVNHRSSPELVQAVNVLFRRRHPFLLPDIGYDDVQPAKQQGGALHIAGNALHPAPLQFRLFANAGDTPLTKEAFQPIAARDAAAEIARLLQAGERGEVRIGNEGISGGDIAVLVRTRQQGRAVALELRAQGVQSVEMGDISVFDSAEAQQLHRLFAALAEREVSPGRRRGALAGDLFGLDVQQLAQLADDDRVWALLEDRLRDWRGIWQQSGAATLIRRLLFAVPINGATQLLRHPDGPRRLTNTLHLAELLQQAETAERLSATGLVEWLADRRREQGRAEDAAQLRLESDERLVKIVTVHRSKGLEFPVTFCPFAWYRRQSWPGATASYHDRNAEGFPEVLDLAPTDAAHELQQAEDQSEELRLLYVALTRAKYRCVATWAQVRDAEHAPLAWLLYGGDRPDKPAQEARKDNARHVRKLSAEAWRRQVLALAEAHPSAIGASDLTPAAPPLQQGEDAEQKLAARRFSRPLLRVRQMTSYSALEAAAGAAVSATEHVEVERPDHDQREEALLAAQSEEGLPPALPEGASSPSPALDVATPAFPRGRRAGDCLHELFEASVKQGDWRGAAESTLTKHGLAVRWAANACALVENALQTPLTPEGSDNALRVADLHRPLAEMEFHTPVRQLDRAQLGECLARHGYGNPFAEGAVDRVDGFLHGYIDVVAEHRGRWHVLDYKSNWLGERVDDYTPAALAAAMRRGGYHLQYLIYLTALHRYLGSRLADYDYDQHIGDVFYLFVRGMRLERPGHSVFRDRPRRECIEAIDRLLAGTGAG